MAHGDPIRYGFAVGRVMVLRARLLGRAAYERLLDAPTLADQKRVLSETHFGRFLESAVTATEVERGVDESMRDLYAQFLDHADLPEPVVAYFRAPYDFGALKGALKSRVLGAPAEPAAVRLGALPAEAFDEPETLPAPYAAVALEVLRAAQPPNAEAIDAAVDRAMFAELGRLARASRVPFLVRLAASEADVANVKVLLRVAIARRTPAAARAMLVPGGTWDADRAAESVVRPEELAEAVAVARVLPAAGSAELLDLARIDLLADAAIARLAREAARGPIGPEPVLAYVLARRAEAVTVRSVLVGRLAGLPRDVVAGRLREAAS
jgi:V/A-type H+/Na+-transporting ATPase subunit C